ncbi:hypothetical protein A3710_24510 [Stutzerimonas frequens]|nr:hypothetical protein A3710_24510 [Stutzerimonas frequens]
MILKQQADRLALEQRLAKADQQSTEKLTNALTENDRLERLYTGHAEMKGKFTHFARNVLMPREFTK